MRAETYAAVDPERLEGRATAEEGLVVGVDHRLVGLDEILVEAASARSVIAPGGVRSGRPDRFEERPRLRRRLLDLLAGIESHTIPPPTQRWMRASAIANVGW